MRHRNRGELGEQAALDARPKATESAMDRRRALVEPGMVRHWRQAQGRPLHRVRHRKPLVFGPGGGGE